MRLQFSLNKIKIDPVCHIQITRHAEEFQGHSNIYGQLYGALYDDEAEVTSILPFPDGEKSTKEELQAMERRNDECLSTYNMDTEKIGWYLVCYKRNFWDNMDTIKYFENYIDTSFFLVFDDKERAQGRNPYRAYRLKDSFALEENFSWADLQKCDLQKDNPLEEIPVQVARNQLFEALILFNKDSLLKELEATQRKKQVKSNRMKENLDEYIQAFEEYEEVFSDNGAHGETGKTSDSYEKNIPFVKYSQYLGQTFKLESYEQHFKEYQRDFAKYSEFFEEKH